MVMVQNFEVMSDSYPIVGFENYAQKVELTLIIIHSEFLLASVYRWHLMESKLMNSLQNYFHSFMFNTALTRKSSP